MILLHRKKKNGFIHIHTVFIYFLRIQSGYHGYQLGEVQISLRRGFDDKIAMSSWVTFFSYGNQISRIALHLDANHSTWVTRRHQGLLCLWFVYVSLPHLNHSSPKSTLPCLDKSM